MKKKYDEYLSHLLKRDFPVEVWNSNGGKDIFFPDGTRMFFGKKEWKIMRKQIEETIIQLEEHIKNIQNNDWE